jgi:hypothetical protein
MHYPTLVGKTVEFCTSYRAFSDRFQISHAPIRGLVVGELPDACVLVEVPYGTRIRVRGSECGVISLLDVE